LGFWVFGFLGFWVFVFLGFTVLGFQGFRLGLVYRNFKKPSAKRPAARKTLSVVLLVLLHADGFTMAAHPTRRGRGCNGTVQVGQGSVSSVPENMQGMARCP
jgi:hypothetical protein